MYAHECTQCGKKFETNRKKRKFCSIDCHGKSMIGKRRHPNSGKKRTKTATTFLCGMCGKSFERTVYPSSAKRNTFEFCSPVCRNKARAIKEIPCPICGTMFKPRVNDTGGVRKRVCSNKCVGVARRGEWYGKRRPTRDRLPPEEYRRRVHGAAKKYMTEHNPMHRPDVVEKVMNYWANNPEKRAQRYYNLAVGKSKVQRDKPTNLEKKLFAILDEYGVEYEPYSVIKPGFIVDARIGRLIIQADGDYWHGHPRFGSLTDRQISQQARDAAQDKYLSVCGYTVERIWESDMCARVVERLLINNNVIPANKIVGSDPSTRG